MNTCYLFAKHFDDEKCLSIRLDVSGLIESELAWRSIDDFKTLQYGAKTVVVIASENTSIHEVEMPLLSANKARPAISYALEENLADLVSEQHFVFSKSHYSNGKYLVVVLDKYIISNIQARLAKFAINYNQITSDWFALNIGEACVVENICLVRDTDFKGAISLDLFDMYLQKHTDYSHIFIFNDSSALKYAQKFSKVEMDTYEWIALKLFQQKSINFCQGEFTHNTNKDKASNYFKWAAILGGVWFASVLVGKILMIFSLNYNLNIYDKKIAEVYRKFFPGAKQVISPRFRVNQVLKKNQSGYDGKFWKLLANFSIATQEYTLKPDANIPNNVDDVTVSNISLQNTTLAVSVVCSDFSVLEKIESNLQKQHINVRQIGAATKDDKIHATLELS